MFTVLKLVGYLWGAFKVIWHLKKLWWNFAVIAGDVGNVWTETCFTEESWGKLSGDGWALLVKGGFTCRRVGEAHPPLG